MNWLKTRAWCPSATVTIAATVVAAYPSRVKSAEAASSTARRVVAACSTRCGAR